MKHFYYTLQTLLHGRGSNLIKVISLALGLLMSVFLFARIAFELSFDGFYRDADHLFIVKTGWMKDGVLQGSEGTYTLSILPGTIAEAFPEQVQSATASCSLFGKDYRLGEARFALPTVMADTLYLATLGLDVLAGNPQDLASPDVIFLSATAARRVFGSDDPVGRTLSYNIGGAPVPMLVKGIFADVPLNNSLSTRPEALVSFASIARHTRWGTGWNSGGNYDGYLRLRHPADAEYLNRRLTATIARYIPAENEGLELSVSLTPIRSLHLANPQVRKMLWVMGLLGAVLLLTTALNYVLISIASLTRRAKAIGVHKCSGASGGSIFSMFLVETGVIIGLALALMALIVYAFHEKMEELAAVPLSTLFAWHNLWAPLGVVAVLFVVGGCLPGMLFSRIPVTQVFRRYTAGRRGWKRVLLFVQFGGAAFIVGMMLLVFAQYSYITGRDRGYTTDCVAYASTRTEQTGQLLSLLRSLPYTEAVATAQQTLIGFISNAPIKDNQGKEMFYPRNSWFDADFLPFMGLKLKEGRNLTGPGQLLVNQPFIDRMHWTDGALGRRVNDYGTVVGVLAPFSFPRQADDKEPVMVEFLEEPGSAIHVRLKPPFDDNLVRLNEEMEHVFPQSDLMFRSLEGQMRSFSDSERVFRDVTLLASLTILFILLMGLVGYVNDEVRLRSKEIAIRKVNGAEAVGVLRLLSKDVLWLAVPAVALGTVGAWRAGAVWISQFSDAMQMPVAGYVAVAMALLAFIVLLVVARAWRIANENPVLSIKSE